MRPEQHDLHILWVTRDAAFTGGAEAYIHTTAKLMRNWGVRNTLMYEVDGQLDADFLAPFEAVLPIVDLPEQLGAMDVQVAYMHQVTPDRVQSVAATGLPVARFLHDHQPFCPREHKFSPWSGATCTRTAGIHCLPCTGGVVRKDGKIRPVSVSGLRQDLRTQSGVSLWVTGSDYMNNHARENGLAPTTSIPLYAAPHEGRNRPVRGQLLYAGALNRGKGVDLLLKMLEVLPTWATLRLAGEGPLRPSLEDAIETRGLRGRVTLLGRLTEAQTRREMDEADLLVIPSRTPETFSLVGVEAASRGLPSVATDVGGIRSWLSDGITGALVPSNDARALGVKVRDILNSPDLRERMSRAAKVSWEISFRPEHHINSLLEELEAIATDPSARVLRSVA